MSSDESIKSVVISSTPHPKKQDEISSSNYMSPVKLSVGLKQKRKKFHSPASKPKRAKTERSYISDFHSSTWIRNTSSSSKSSKTSWKSNKQKKISFSPIEKCLAPPLKLKVSPFSESSENTGLQEIIDLIDDEFKQENEIKADNDEILAESVHSLSITPEEKPTDFKGFVKKEPEHLVEKKEMKRVRKKLDKVKKFLRNDSDIKDESTLFMHKDRIRMKPIFPKFYPLGWMALYNVGRHIIRKVLRSESKSKLIPRVSNFETYGTWKMMRKEGLILKTPPQKIKEEEYSLPIEITKKEKSKNKTKKQSSETKRREYYDSNIKQELKSEVLSDNTIEVEAEQIRNNSSTVYETPKPQNLSDDFIGLMRTANVTIRRDTIKTSILKKKDTSGTSMKFKNGIKIISVLEFEDSTKIRIPPEILRQYRDIYNI